MYQHTFIFGYQQIEVAKGECMKTLIKIEKTSTGWAHWYRVGALVLIEFVEGGN
jgi:hypothetical protein